MEEIQITPQPEVKQPSFFLPPHKNKMVLSIIVTLCCCLIGGIIAIINSSKSNNLYNSALFATDDATKQMLYAQSEASNATAQTWITISLVVGALGAIISFITAFAEGLLSSL